MAGRSTYDEGDKARGYVALVTADWLIKRAARESGFPESTLRRWAKEFRENGPPATDEVEAAAGDAVDDMERIRNKALLQIEAKLPTAKVGELNTTVAILTDKIAAARGLAIGRVEHVHKLPSPDEIRAALAAMNHDAQQAHDLRESEIEDAEFTVKDAKALPPARTKA